MGTNNKLKYSQQRNNLQKMPFDIFETSPNNHAETSKQLPAPLDPFNPDNFYLKKSLESLNSINRPEDACSPYTSFLVRQPQIDINDQLDEQEDVFDTSFYLISPAKNQNREEEADCMLNEDDSHSLGTESSMKL